MTVQQVMYAPERESHEFYPVQPPELESRHDATMHVGAMAIHIHSLGEMSPVDQVGLNRGANEMVDMKNKTTNPEGSHNAELFKQAYDEAIEAIENAYKADSTELGDTLVAVLHSIDALSTTPYISSAPEFVGLVKAARHNVEQAHSLTSSDTNSESNIDVVNALSQARQQLTATTVAYRP